MIDARGAPPILTKAANAEIAIITGIVTPTPVNALGPTLGICPIYMRSTILYNTFIICAKIAGKANFNNNGPKLSLPKSASFFFFTLITPFIYFKYPMSNYNKFQR